MFKQPKNAHPQGRTFEHNADEQVN